MDTSNKTLNSPIVIIDELNDEQDAELAQQMYAWLDEQLGDRDEKDAETLEIAALILVG